MRNSTATLMEIHKIPRRTVRLLRGRRHHRLLDQALPAVFATKKVHGAQARAERLAAEGRSEGVDMATKRQARGGR